MNLYGFIKKMGAQAQDDAREMYPGMRGKESYRDAWDSAVMDVQNNAIGTDELANVPGDDEALKSSVKGRLKASSQYQRTPDWTDPAGRAVVRK